VTDRGIVVGLANSQSHNYKLLFDVFLKHLRAVTNLPVFVLTNFQQSFDVEYQEYVDFQQYQTRRIINAHGKQTIEFSNKIKILSCVRSPFARFLFVDVDYLFFQQDLDRYFTKKGLVIPLRTQFIGDSIKDKDLIFSWVFKFDQSDREFLQTVLKHIDQYFFTDRYFYYLLKTYPHSSFDFIVYSSGYRTKFLGYNETQLNFQYQSSLLQCNKTDCHISDKRSIL
jgi:hypothetical protein